MRIVPRVDISRLYYKFFSICPPFSGAEFFYAKFNIYINKSVVNGKIKIEIFFDKIDVLN